ncbi:major facilitator superfamily domain-containing protein [Poronia punctata]|nr:major facilitator superfamily domain-containing protein [Poronia punctata]
METAGPGDCEPSDQVRPSPSCTSYHPNNGYDVAREAHDGTAGPPALTGEGEGAVDGGETGPERQSPSSAQEGGRPESGPELSRQKSILPDRNSPIEYFYLTFDTTLPTPALAPEAVALEPPDLSHYVNPLQWPRTRKNVMLTLSCVATMLTAYTAGAYSPPVDIIAAELGTTRQVALLGVTTFCLGFALAPMVLAPFSEINGRYPVFAIAGIFFTLFQGICSVVTNVPGMLLARFIHGAGGSVFSTMVGGVISDMFVKEARNTPMALFSGAVLAGTGLGPLVSSIIVQTAGSEGQTWKWVFWHQTIADFVLIVAVIGLFKESRGSVVLSKKAKVLNKWYEKLEQSGSYGVLFHERMPSVSPILRAPGPDRAWPGSEGSTPRRIRWITVDDEQRGSLAAMVSTSLTRPFHLLFTEPIVFFFSLWVSFAWAVLYLTFGSIPLVFRRQYNFTIEQSGFVFVSMIVGGILATVAGIYQDKLLKHPKWVAESASSSNEDESKEAARPALRGPWAFIRRKFPAESPESRLYFTCFAAVLLPVGLYLFGFSAQPTVHWIVPTVGIGLATMGIYYIYLATFNYLADIYHIYASSALAAQSFCRNVLGGVFPLLVAMLFTNLGEDAAGGVLGTIAAILTVVPWALVLYGEKIRHRSKFAVSLSKPT